MPCGNSQTYVHDCGYRIGTDSTRKSKVERGIILISTKIIRECSPPCGHEGRDHFR